MSLRHGFSYLADPLTIRRHNHIFCKFTLVLFSGAKSQFLIALHAKDLYHCFHALINILCNPELLVLVWSIVPEIYS